MNKIISCLILLCFSLAVIAQKDTSYITLEVKVTNFKEVPLKGEKIILEIEKTKQSFSGISGANGIFKLDVLKGKTYIIKYLTINDNVEYQKFTMPNFKGMASPQLHIKIEPGKVYELKNVFFDTDKATIKPQSYKAINNLVEVMKIKPNLIIEISGHTDNIGDGEHNMKLSQDRAESVKAYLVKNKISAGRITAKGYGFTMPVADNDTPEGRQKNRRTEVKIIKE